MANKERFELVKYSNDKNWLIAKNENRYYIFDATGEKPTPFETPRGKLFNTSYYVLAERALADLEKYGEHNMTAESVIPWHFTMVDNFSQMKHEQVEAILDECFLQKYDWTYVSEHEEVFGDLETRISEIREWLSKCTHMQMTAVCCIGNAYHSINVAYVLAHIIENCSGSLLKEQIQLLAKMVEEDGAILEDLESILRVFSTFQLYYGIHCEEHGPTINKQFSPITEDESSDEITDDSDIEEDDDDDDVTPEYTERSVAIVTELLEIGRKEGFITSEDLPHIPELFIHAGDIAIRLFKEMTEYAKTDPKAHVTGLTFLWCAYAGIGAVYHWHTNWKALSQNGIFATLTKERGVYEMDEYVHDCIGKPYLSPEGKELNMHLSNIIDCCFYRLASKGNVTFEKVLEAAKAMYLYGMVLEMNVLGMR